MKKMGPSFAITCVVFIATLFLISCGNENGPVPQIEPVISEFFPYSGLISCPVVISGNNFVPATDVSNPLLRYSTVKFNGTITIPTGDYVNLGNNGEQIINTNVPIGATSGKITITTSSGITGSSTNDFRITVPVYEPNVTVETAFGAAFGITPRGVAIDANGNLYVSDFADHKILKLTKDGPVTLLTTTIENNAGFGIAVDANDNVYAAVGHTIQKIKPDGTITQFGPDFIFVNGLAIDANDNVYVSGDGIRKITQNGAVSILADGAWFSKPFGPQGIAVDAIGNVYVADTGNHKISKITPEGFVITVAGSTAGYWDGVGVAAQFYEPFGIAINATDDIYVGDSKNHVIRKISPDGNVTTVAGTTNGDSNGPGWSARFNIIYGLAVNATGTIYIADSYNFKIRKIEIK